MAKVVKKGRPELENSEERIVSESAGLHSWQWKRIKEDAKKRKINVAFMLRRIVTVYYEVVDAQTRIENGNAAMSDAEVKDGMVPGFELMREIREIQSIR